MAFNFEKQDPKAPGMMVAKMAESGFVDLTAARSKIQVGETLNVQGTFEEERKVLRKIDRL